MCNMYPSNRRHSALVCALVRCQCFQGFAVLGVQKFKLTLSTPEVETFHSHACTGLVRTSFWNHSCWVVMWPLPMLEPMRFLQSLEVALLLLRACFARNSCGLMVLVLTGCPDIRVGQLGGFFPHSLSARSLTCCLHELSHPPSGGTPPLKHGMEPISF